jgi:hypothetical protein
LSQQNVVEEGWLMFQLVELEAEFQALQNVVAE